jgi:DNA-binding IclR family transcriptional regulator
MASSAAQIARVLKTLARHRGGIGMTDIARSCGFPRSTASRVLSQMVAAGLVERDTQNRCYGPGLLIFEAARQFKAGDALLEAAELAVSDLAGRTGHSVGISIRTGHDVMAIRQRTGTQPLRVVMPLGDRAPVVGTSTGRTLLARMTNDEIEQLLSPFPRIPSERAPGTLAALMDRIEVIRRRGWEEAVDEVLPGLAAVAVAVECPRSGEQYAIFVAFSALHVQPAQRANIVANLIAEARRMGDRFGDTYWTELSGARVDAS